MYNPVSVEKVQPTNDVGEKERRNLRGHPTLKSRGGHEIAQVAVGAMFDHEVEIESVIIEVDVSHDKRVPRQPMQKSRFLFGVLILG